jgi:hypothetical protein
MAMSLSFTSCDWIDPDLNNDPDAVKEVPLKLLLPSIEVRMAYILGGQDVAGVTSMWTQQSQGVARQSGIINNYNITEADVNNLWGSFFDGGMMDAHILINQADEESPHYKGIGQVLMAVWLGNATDLFGDVPYSEAFQGAEGNLTPAYDSQQSIYQTIQTLLDDAIANLQSTNNVIPVEGDYFFGGDAGQWLKVAYTLKARYTLHLSEVNGNAALTEVINIVTGGKVLEGNSDDLAFWFGENTTENNPVYQFCDQRGDIRNGPAFFSALNDDNDPRVYVYQANPSETYYGGLVYGQRASRVDLLTYSEMLFMAAEAYSRTNQPGQAADYLIQAVKANTDKYRGYSTDYDAAIDDWMNAKTAEWQATPPTLEEIMTQKWLALYLNPEVWVDYRRTGYPQLVPVTGNNIPLRFLYPTDERLYNPNTPETTIWQPVWWDK